jgi:RNA polymerase sigma-70 factor (ECF subfamily)
MIKMTDKEFEEIFQKTKKAVLGAINKYLAKRFYHSIDDVVQETYLRAFRAICNNSIKDMEKLKSYLYTIAKNESFRMNEKFYREEKKAAQIKEFHMTEITGNAREWDAEHFSASMDDVIERLPDLPVKYCQVLELYLSGHRVSEISFKLNLKPGTVKSRTTRGIKILKKLMEA